MSTDGTSNESESSLEVMGVALSQPKIEESGTTDSQLESMLSKDLTQGEKDAYMGMLHHYSNIFISDYEHITGVTVIKHHI